MVAVGATISAFWIIVANSWQQTPAGFVIAERARRADRASAAAVFNPSTMPRYFHTVDAALIAGAFVMAGVAAWLPAAQGRHADLAKKALPAGARRRAGRLGRSRSSRSGTCTRSRWRAPSRRSSPPSRGSTPARAGRPLVLFALPVDRPPALKAAVEIPGLLSWLAFGDVHAPVQGINEFPPEDQPPLWLTFVSFHNMVVLGLFFIAAMGWGVLQLLRGKLWERRRFLRLLVWSIPLPVVACQLGWVAAEVGRQPWIVYRLLRTVGRRVAARCPPATILASRCCSSRALYLALGALWLFLMVPRGAATAPQPVRSARRA